MTIIAVSTRDGNNENKVHLLNEHYADVKYIVGLIRESLGEDFNHTYITDVKVIGAIEVSALYSEFMRQQKEWS